MCPEGYGDRGERGVEGLSEGEVGGEEEGDGEDEMEWYPP